MSQFTSAVTASSIDWAIESDSSDDELEVNEIAVVKVEEDSSSDEEDDDDEISNTPAGSKPDMLPEKSKPQPIIVNLSKKDRKILKEKELADLDSLLSELGVEVKPAESSVPEKEIADSDVATKTTTESKIKKKKKPVVKTAEVKKDVEISEAGEQQIIPPANVDFLLKQRAAAASAKAKKSTSSNSSISTAAKLAAAEAKLAASSLDKKKTKAKKKIGYSETSY